MSPDAPLNSRDVVLLPYLRFPGRLSVGPWEVIPRSELTRTDATTQAVFEVLPKYLDLYAIPKCVFRRCQPLIPVEASHPFRLKTSQGVSALRRAGGLFLESDRAGDSADERRREGPKCNLIIGLSVTAGEAILAI